MGRRDLTAPPASVAPGPPAPGHRYRRLTAVDRMYLALESPTAPMHFGALAIVDAGAPGVRWLDPDGGIRLADVRRELDARVAALPGLRRLAHDVGPLAGPPLWIEDPAFAIEHHVGAFELASAAAADGEAGLFRAIERQMAPPLDRSHPMWQAWFVGGLADRRAAVLFTIHHALADGLSAMRLARELLAPRAAPATDREASSAQRHPVPPWPELTLDHALETWASGRRLLRGDLTDDIRSAVRQFGAGWAAARGEPDSGLNVIVGARRRLAVLRLDARAVKRAARAHGAGANDLVLDLVAGGLRALLAGRGQDLGRIRPRAGIAVALPGAGDDVAAGNRFGSYVVPLPLGEADPITRLAQVAEARDRAKGTQSISGITGFRAWTARFGPTREFMRHQRYINLMETYLPGPPTPIEVLGAPVIDLIPIQPLGRNVGLTFIASSYAGRLTLTVRADPDAFPDLDVLLAAMEREWAEVDAGVDAGMGAGVVAGVVGGVDAGVVARDDRSRDESAAESLTRLSGRPTISSLAAI